MGRTCSRSRGRPATGGASSLAPLAIYVALVGAEFEVIEPPALADYLLVLAARLTRAAQGRLAPR